MKQFESQTIKNVALNKVPDFYRSVAGNPYADRVANKSTKSGLIVRRQKFETAQMLEDSGFGTFFTTFRLEHNLGFQPYPMGQLTIGDDYFPVPYSDFTGNTIVSYTHINNNRLDLFVSATGQALAKIKIYLLREGLI